MMVCGDQIKVAGGAVRVNQESRWTKKSFISFFSD